MKPTLFILSLSLFISNIALACFWDYDTIEMERQQFPSVIELLSGNFLRHSEEFHYWRIHDRKSKLEATPDRLSLLDDLAVSLSKTGNDAKAIEIGLRQLERSPKRYETLANLGTFYLHSGDLESGIRYIDKAIAVNPSAHFGREIYQRHLAAYLLSKKQNGKIPLPLSSNFRHHPERPPQPEELDNFYQFLVDNKNSISSADDQIRRLPEEELEEAVIGIMGMMTFGNPNSPILAEVLGDLLMASGWLEGARQLAARAYLKAAYHCGSKEAKQVYLKRISFTLYHQFTHKNGSQFAIEDLEALFKEEIAQGEAFFNELRANEINWIAQGKDPEQEYAKTYYIAPTLDERIQTGTRERGDRSSMDLSDTLIGTMVDVRAVHAFHHQGNKEAKEMVDSLMSKGLQDQEREDEPLSIEEPTAESSETPPSKMNWAMIISLILLAGIGIWAISRQKKQ